MFNIANGNFQPPYWMTASNGMQTDISGITPFMNASSYYGNSVPATSALANTVETAKSYNKPIINADSNASTAQVIPYQIPQNTPVSAPVTPVQQPPVFKPKTVDQVIRPEPTLMNNAPTEAGWGDKLADTMIELSQGKTYSQTKRLMKDFVDCSSLVARSMQKMGLPWDPNSIVTRNMTAKLLKDKYTQVGTASALDYSTKDLKRGDILLFPSTDNHAGHVMVYNGDGNVIEANGWNGSHVGVNPWGSFNRKNRQYQVWRR